MSCLETIFLIHHSHTDIGYTHDQPILWDLQRRFLNEAIAAAEMWMATDADHSFRWTVETTRPLVHWLRTAKDRDIERFLKLERDGRIEVTGMPLNITPLYDQDEMIEGLLPVARLRNEFGISIRYAMNCDVNGQNWPLADLLLDAGIEAMSMAINTHFGGYPLNRPCAFNWQAPSGRILPIWNGFPYESGYRFGIGRDESDFENHYLPALEKRLLESGYALPILMLQSFHPFGDNGSAYPEFSRFIRRWNAAGKKPRLIMATPSMWWEALADYQWQLTTHGGDWTDYWNFGCISSAHEQAINRRNRFRLRSADAATTIACAFDTSDGIEPTESHGNWTCTYSLNRDKAWGAVMLWDEHTWGAECSVSQPWAEDTLTQWHHKASTAYRARSLSTMLQRDAFAEIARYIGHDAGGDIVLFNPLPFPRTIAGALREGVMEPRGPADDPTAGRHWQDRDRDDCDSISVHGESASSMATGAPTAPAWFLPPTEVPGFGYRRIARNACVATPRSSESWTMNGSKDQTLLENSRYRLELDAANGGVKSWYDITLGREWVDTTYETGFGLFVRERLDESRIPSELQKSPAAARKQLFEIDFQSRSLERDAVWKPDWPRQYSYTGKPVQTTVHRYPHGIRGLQRLPRDDGRGDVVWSVFLPDFEDYIHFEAWWHMTDDPWPESTYLVFPFRIDHPEARYDVGGQAVRADVDQIPGSCRDYFTVQSWTDLSNADHGVTIASPENPMVQLGSFSFGRKRSSIRLNRALFVGWITSNYWDTNFRASQPGLVHGSYFIRPHLGQFDEASAHRFGAIAATSQPIAQHTGERPVHDDLPRPLPETGSFLELPGSQGVKTSILVLSVKPADNFRRVVVRLLNAGERAETARIADGLLSIQGAETIDLLEHPIADGTNSSLTDTTRGTASEPLPITFRNGEVEVEIPARRVASLLLTLSRTPTHGESGNGAADQSGAGPDNR